MEKFQKLTKFWLPLFAWATLIFFLSSKPVKPVSTVTWQDFLVKKTFHLIEYGAFFLLSYRGFLNTTSFEKRKIALWSFSLAIFYGAIDEFHQSFTPGRQAHLRDVLIDGLGALLAWWALWRYLPKAPKKLKNWAQILQIV